MNMMATKIKLKMMTIIMMMATTMTIRTMMISVWVRMMFVMTSTGIFCSYTLDYDQWSKTKFVLQLSHADV